MPHFFSRLIAGRDEHPHLLLPAKQNNQQIDMDKMKMILALLVAKFPGVRKDGLNMLARLMALQTETEDEAKAAVERLTRDGVDAFVRDFRSDVDKEVSDGTRTFEENLRRKFDLVEKQSEPRADEVKPKADPMPKKREGADAETDLQAVVANAVANAVKPLKEQLERYERGNVNQSRLQALTDRLNACKDESFRAKALKDFGRMTFDTEEAFNEYLTDTETDVADANKRMADAKLAGMGRPMFSQKDESGVTASVARYINAQTKGSDASLGGKEL